jgi:hypothetical protein
MGPERANTGPHGSGSAGGMSDSALEFAEERGLGKVLGRVRLGSKLPNERGARARATLLLSSSGLWLVEAHDRFQGQHVDLLTLGDLRLQSGRLRDRLCFGQEQLLIPAGRRRAVERLVALARLAGHAHPPSSSSFKACRSIHAPDELARAWFNRELAPGEVLLAWLRGANLQPVTSHIVGETRCPPHLFVTERRAALVAWSAVGDVSYSALHTESTRLQSSDERTELLTDDATFVSRRSDVRVCRDAFELLNLRMGKVRILEAARRTWLARERDGDEAARCISLLDAAIEQGSQRARFARLLATVEQGEVSTRVDGASALQALQAGQLSPTALGDLWTSFRFSVPAASALVRGLLEVGDPGLPFALAVQRRAHTEPTADEETARDELALASYAISARLATATRPDERDLELQRALLPHGLAAGAAPVVAVHNPLAQDAIENVLSHPLARGQASLVAGAQRLIALSPEPDHGALSDYCEALDDRERPEAKRALDAARLAFSLPTLHAYVSRGKKSIGLRGYEAKAPYILLGKAHLDPESPYRMSEAELCFAIGAEALHLKLGQARLTSHEVWAGALARTRGGVELALSVLPLLKGLPLAVSASRLLDKIPEPALRRGLDALVRIEQARKPAPDTGAPPSALSHINENLFAAHRVMQMSADRAGVLLCGDLRASLRGLLLVRPDTQAFLERMVLRDLTSVLLESATPADSAMRADLIVRVAALIQFYGSEEYLQLRRTLTGGG